MLTGIARVPPAPVTVIVQAAATTAVGAETGVTVMVSGLGPVVGRIVMDAPGAHV